MEEMEVPTEHLHEAIKEKAEEARERWVMYLALSTAFIAVLAAIAGLLGGHHANEAMIEEIKASNQWSYYQSKSIKSELAEATDKILLQVSSTPIPGDNKERIARYEKEKETIKQTAEAHEKASETHLEQHKNFAKAVTIFQIAIAISAIAILTRKRVLWYGAIALTLAGSYFLFAGF
ncbi:uncharacterized protein DUF4337 [Chitinophaga niastensis]|uniref:Uncharacterized protein DUF4337 n=1 Tax=Chitinophaga niastensis TaxID=536980 RepID=A0A2P8HQ70_CHINA|nr:DUF4337 domain-containing protein [Chitinophaga niastensis]PSL48380.1 uncharacterized protein DUF4337 [Chitinophaga niastensis]